jgi:hypothetical protein
MEPPADFDATPAGPGPPEPSVTRRLIGDLDGRTALADPGGVVPDDPWGLGTFEVVGDGQIMDVRAGTTGFGLRRAGGSLRI